MCALANRSYWRSHLWWESICSTSLSGSLWSTLAHSLAHRGIHFILPKHHPLVTRIRPDNGKSNIPLNPNGKSNIPPPSHSHNPLIYDSYKKIHQPLTLLVDLYIVWSQIGSLWPACLPGPNMNRFTSALPPLPPPCPISPAPPAPSLLPSRLLPVTRMSGRRSSHPAPTCAQLAPSSTRTSSVQIFSCSLKAEKHKYQVLAGQFNPVMSCIRKS